MEQSLGENKIVTKNGRKSVFADNVTAKTLKNNNSLKQIIIKETSEDVYRYISETVGLSHNSTILQTALYSNIYENIDGVKTIIDLQPINKHYNLNQHFNTIHNILPVAGNYIGCFESYWERKEKLQEKYSPIIFKTIWFMDFLLHRVMPKLRLTKELYKYFFKRNNLAISFAETLGRLSYCGFDILDYKRIGNYNYFVVNKTMDTYHSKFVSIGLIFKMERIGKSGKIIKVYKLRTMHPYSEYLQRYVLRLHGYDNVGKPANDFRVTSWGRIFRKLWIDELPQLINVLKGEMNIVGVRPLSKVSFSLLPEDLKIIRIKYKPGCIPPNVSLCMTGLEGVMNAEREYLYQMQKHPWLTNISFLFKAIFNILTKKISSR